MVNRKRHCLTKVAKTLIRVSWWEPADDATVCQVTGDFLLTQACLQF